MILILVEKNLDGSAVEVSLEALTFARNLSAVGGGVPIDAVVVASDGQSLTDELRKELAAYEAEEEITPCTYGHEAFNRDRSPVAFVICIVVDPDNGCLAIGIANFCSACADQMTREHLVDLSMQMTEEMTAGLAQEQPRGRLH